MTQIAFAFTPKQPIAIPPGQTQTTVKEYGHAVLRAITPVYVDFFEKHRLWIKATFGGDPNAWPPLFNFARVLRNFISHHAGRVHFANQNAPAVTWHHLQYSPADEGATVIGNKVQLGEIIVLMFELSDELDRAGCPLDP